MIYIHGDVLYVQYMLWCKVGLPKSLAANYRVILLKGVFFTETEDHYKHCKNRSSYDRLFVYLCVQYIRNKDSQCQIQ
jgi:hypothetical protein